MNEGGKELNMERKEERLQGKRKAKGTEEEGNLGKQPRDLMNRGTKLNGNEN